MDTLFAWGKNATSFQLPKDVAIPIKYDYLVMQTHYLIKFPDNLTDNSSIKLTLSDQVPTKVAAIFLLLSQKYFIPPKLPVFYMNISCEYKLPFKMHIFAFRVHAHSLGVNVSGYVIKNNGRDWIEIGSKSPQLPQAFYQTAQPISVEKGDALAARCIFNSSSKKEETLIGSTHTDEMCNFYIMFYADNSEKFSPDEKLECVDNEDEDFFENFGKKKTEETTTHGKNSSTEEDEDSKTSTSFQDFLEIKNLKKVENWPSPSLKFGQISGVSATPDNKYVIIFHRANHEWNEKSFSKDGVYQFKDDGPIKDDPVVVVDAVTGELVFSFGKNIFYLPHGISMNPQGTALYLTDVALHQVYKISFKLASRNGFRRLLILGTKFEPGSDLDHFCMPTSVAVESNGNFYVADGYCNSRIIKYRSSGGVISVLGASNPYSPLVSFNIPHSLSISESPNILFVADRESQRVVCVPLSDSHGLDSCLASAANKGPIYAVSSSEDTFVSLTGTNALNAGVLEPPPSLFIYRMFPNPNSMDKTLFTFAYQWNGTTKNHAGFTNPHDVYVMPALSLEIYVVELNGKVWKIIEGEEEAYTNPTKNENRFPTSNQPSSRNSGISQLPTYKVPSYIASILPRKSIHGLYIVIAVLAVPVLLLIFVFYKSSQNNSMRRIPQSVLAIFKKPSEYQRLNVNRDVGYPKNSKAFAILDSDDDENEDDMEEDEMLNFKQMHNKKFYTSTK